MVALASFLLVCPPVAAEPAHSDEEARALALFEQSEARFRAGAFREAAELLRQAYDLYPEPLLLYNLARSLEGEGDLAGAIDAYTRYLDEAKQIADRAAIERQIDTLRDQIRERERLHRERVAAERARVAAEAQLRARVDNAPAPRHSKLPWITLGVGVVSVGAGGVLGLRSRALHDDAVDEPEQLASVELQDRARSYATGANVAFAVGAALSVTGLIWGILDVRRSHRRNPPVAVGFAPGMVVVEGRLP